MIFQHGQAKGYNSAEEAREAFSKKADKSDKALYLDKKGRPVFLKKEAFEHHTSNKYLEQER